MIRNSGKDRVVWVVALCRCYSEFKRIGRNDRCPQIYVCLIRAENCIYTYSLLTLPKLPSLMITYFCKVFYFVNSTKIIKLCMFCLL